MANVKKTRYVHKIKLKITVECTVADVMLYRKQQRAPAEVMNPIYHANSTCDYPAGPVCDTTWYDTVHKNNEHNDGVSPPTGVADAERYDNMHDESPVTYKTFKDDEMYSLKLPPSDDSHA